MKLARWILISMLAAVLVAALPEARPGGPGRALAVATIPGANVPLVHLGAAPQQPAGGILSATFDDQSLRKTDRIAPILDKLYRVDQLARAATGRGVTAGAAPSLSPDLAGMAASRDMRLDDAGRVQVWIDAAGGTAAANADLAALGAAVQTVDAQHGIVQAMVPINQLAAASALSSARDVRLPAYGFAETGSQESQGDAILNASTLRNSITAYGSGVRVGVISDGWEGMAASQSTSDLPAVVDTTTCNVSPGTTSPSATGAGAEGTAMAEIVHDLAPDAQIFAGYWGMRFTGTALDFNNAVSCLAAHTDVVVDDVGFFNLGPDDGTSLVSANTSAALNNPANPIRGYYTAVANQAMEHYHGAWSDSGYITGNSPSGDWWEMQQFAGGGGTTDGTFGLGCVSASAPFCGDSFELATGATASVFLQWNDPFGSSTSDYDLLLFNYATGIVSPASVSRQGVGFPSPIEAFSVTNSGAPAAYAIIIGKYKNLAPARTFDMFVNCNGCYVFNTGLPVPDNYSFHNFNTLAGSVPNQSDSGGGVVSVGAISGQAANAPYTTIESYSSRGPTVDARTKPDITGIDCVAITGAAGFPNPFCGSSAAAPHVAGIAALLLSCDPLLLAGSGVGTPATNRTFLQNALLGGTVTLGAPAVNNTYGHGRADAMLAAPLGNCVSTSGDGYPDGLKTSLGKTVGNYCAIMRADLNGDGVVNGVDLNILAKWFTQAVPPAPPRVDQSVPLDNIINGVDLNKLAAVFTKSVSLCP